MRTIYIIISFYLMLVFAAFANFREENQDENAFINTVYQQLINKLNKIENEDVSKLGLKKTAINEAKRISEEIKEMRFSNRDPSLTKSQEDLEKELQKKLDDENSSYRVLVQQSIQRKEEITIEKSKLEKYRDEWQRNKSEEKLGLLAEAITKIACKYNITANVRWITTPKPGALIYYQN